MGYSSGTALVALVNNLWKAWDRGRVSVLSLLAASDITDHGNFLDWLCKLGGTILWWFSFLCGLYQSVVV